MENQRERERDRSRRGDRPSRFSDAPRDRSNDRERSEGKRLFVSNIPYEFRWTELKDLFKEKVGIISYVNNNDSNSEFSYHVSFSVRQLNLSCCMVCLTSQASSNSFHCFLSAAMLVQRGPRFLVCLSASLCGLCS